MLRAVLALEECGNVPQKKKRNNKERRFCYNLFGGIKIVIGMKENNSRIICFLDIKKRAFVNQINEKKKFKKYQSRNKNETVK